jgi:hypothetical protein
MWDSASIPPTCHGMVLEQSEISFVHLNHNETKMLGHPKFPTAPCFSNDYINPVIFAIAVMSLDNLRKSTFFL